MDIDGDSSLCCRTRRSDGSSVEHRDRLARFGVEYIEAALVAQGREVVVVESGEHKLDLVQDFVDVVTIYGQRAAKNRAKQESAVA
jgi:predicted site-specific integrase-resolvase